MENFEVDRYSWHYHLATQWGGLKTATWYEMREDISLCEYIWRVSLGLVAFVFMALFFLGMIGSGLIALSTVFAIVGDLLGSVFLGGSFLAPDTAIWKNELTSIITAIMVGASFFCAVILVVGSIAFILMRVIFPLIGLVLDAFVTFWYWITDSTKETKMRHVASAFRQKTCVKVKFK